MVKVTTTLVRRAVLRLGLARQVVAWQLACIVGGYILVLLDPDAYIYTHTHTHTHTHTATTSVTEAASEPGQRSSGGRRSRGESAEGEADVSDVSLACGRRMVEEGVSAVLAEPQQVAALVVAVAETLGRHVSKGAPSRLLRDIVVVGSGQELSLALAPLVDSSLESLLANSGRGVQEGQGGEGGQERGAGGGLLLQGVDLDFRRCTDGLAVLTLRCSGAWGGGGGGGVTRDITRQISIHALDSLEQYGKESVRDGWETWAGDESSAGDMPEGDVTVAGHRHVYMYICVCVYICM
jgi:hypothetical protein